MFAATLLGEDRQPLLGGALFVRPPLSLEPLLLPERARVVALPYAKPRAPGHTAQSDRSGRVVLAVQAGDPSPAGDGLLELRALAPGCAAVSVRAAPPAAGSIRELGELVLPRGRTLRGRVDLPQGIEMERARVLLSLCIKPDDDPVVREEQKLFGPVQHGVVDQAVLGPAGAFELTGVPTGPRTVWAYAPGTTFARFDVGEGSADQDGLVLSPSPLVGVCTVEGRVHDPDGAPVDRAFVHVLYADEERAGTTVSSDADGYFRAPLRRSERFTLVALDRPFLLGEARVEAGPCEQDVVVRLPGRPTFRLIVVETGGGERVANASVEVRDPTGRDLLHYGHAEVERGLHEVALPTSPFALRVAAPGHRTALLPLSPQTVGSEVLCELELDADVVGLVTQDGAPVPGARVSLQQSMSPAHWAPSPVVSGYERPFALKSSASVSEALTDGQGRFALSSAAEGWHVVRAAKDSRATALSERIQLAEGGPRLEVHLELRQTGSVAGRVLVRPGLTAAGILVGASSGDGFAHCRYTDAEGRYFIAGLSPGGCQIRRCRDSIGAQLAADLTLKMGSQRDAEVLGEPTWDCSIAAGATTAFDLDLRDEGAFVLEGRSSLFTGGFAELRPAGVRTGWPLASVSILQDGSFRVPMSAPGTFALLVSGNGVKVHDGVVLERGPTTWRYEPILGDLVLKLSPDAPQPLREKSGALIYVCREPSGTEVRTMCSLKGKQAEEGRRISLPSGAAVIDHAPRGPDSYKPSDSPLATVFVPANGEVEVVLGAGGVEDD